MTCLKMTKDRLRNFIPLVNNESAGADHRSVPALSLSKRHIICQNERERSCNRAQAARALPFPLGRKRKQKGPFCTARRQRQDGATLKPVRRDAQKLAASRRSNNLCARFFTARVAVKNPLTSHAVSKALCCLGLPSAVTLMNAGREKCFVVIFDRLRSRPL